jgi:hypothetical protein
MARRAIAARAFVAVVFAHVALAGSADAADANAEKKACVDAATRGQIQRDDGKLGAAAEAFATCAQPICPAAVRSSCEEWLADARARRPSLVIELPPRTDDSAAGATPKISIDGVAGEPGASVALDPGSHVVRVEPPDGEPYDLSFVLAEREHKTLVARRPAPATSSVAAARDNERPIPISVFVLGGVAVVGVASFATFGLMAKSDTDRLRDECAPACPTGDRDDAFGKALVADISLGIAAAAVIAAGVLYVLRPTHAVPKTAGLAF